MKIVNIGLIGAGWIGKVHSECFQRVESMFGLTPGTVRLHTVADLDSSLAEQAKNQFGFQKSVVDWHDLLSNREIDVIDICVANKLHLEIVKAAARAGKHILCEKPLALNATQAARMVEIVRREKRINLINFNYRKVPAIAFIKRLLDAGEIGKIYNFRSFFAQDFGMDESLPYSWRFNSEDAGGGSIVTMGSHVIDIAHFLIGDIVSLVSDSETFIRERPSLQSPGRRERVDVDDKTSAMVKFRNGATGIIQSCWTILGRKHFFQIEIYGSKGSVIFESERLNEVKLFQSDKGTEAQGFKTVLIGANHPYGNLFNLKTGMGIGIKESFVVQLGHFIQAVLESAPASPDFHEGYRVQKVIDAIKRSVETRKWEQV
jgi:predicted dehydrogenase